MVTIAADIEDIIRTIWSTMFELPIELDSDHDRAVARQVTAVVHIEGAWHGAVMIQTPLALASMLTAGLFQADAPPTTAEISDALGEVTNMVAGNLKALLPEPSAISLPAVALGSDYEVAVIGTTVVARVPFLCAGQPLVVTVVKGREAERGAA